MQCFPMRGVKHLTEQIGVSHRVSDEPRGAVCLRGLSAPCMARAGKKLNSHAGRHINSLYGFSGIGVLLDNTLERRLLLGNSTY